MIHLLVDNIEFSVAASREYQKLDPEVRNKIDEELDALANVSLIPGRSRMLIGGEVLRSGRVGDWRILFFFDNHALTVVRVKHRREIYDNL